MRHIADIAYGIALDTLRLARLTPQEFGVAPVRLRQYIGDVVARGISNPETVAYEALGLFRQELQVRRSRHTNYKPAVAA